MREVVSAEQETMGAQSTLSEDADNDPLYDMHVKNAENLLKSVNLSH